MSKIYLCGRIQFFRKIKVIWSSGSVVACLEVSRKAFLLQYFTYIFFTRNTKSGHEIYFLFLKNVIRTVNLYEGEEFCSRFLIQCKYFFVYISHLLIWLSSFHKTQNVKCDHFFTFWLKNIKMWPLIQIHSKKCSWKVNPICRSFHNNYKRPIIKVIINLFIYKKTSWAQILQVISMRITQPLSLPLIITKMWPYCRM